MNACGSRLWQARARSRPARSTIASSPSRSASSRLRAERTICNVWKARADQQRAIIERLQMVRPPRPNAASTETTTQGTVCRLRERCRRGSGPRSSAPTIAFQPCAIMTRIDVALQRCPTVSTAGSSPPTDGLDWARGGRSSGGSVTTPLRVPRQRDRTHRRHDRVPPAAVSMCSRSVVRPTRRRWPSAPGAFVEVRMKRSQSTTASCACRKPSLYGRRHRLGRQGRTADVRARSRWSARAERRCPGSGRTQRGRPRYEHAAFGALAKASRSSSAAKRTVSMRERAELRAGA